MLLRYKPCWETYGEEREEGSEEGRKRGRKEGRKEVKLHQTCTSAQKKKVWFAGMNGALIIYPGMLVRV